VPQSPQKVWEAITDPKAFGSWYNAEVRIEPHLGGKFEVDSGPFTWHGSITAWKPESMFGYEHNHAPHEAMPKGAQTQVRWELQPEGEGTRLTFTQAGLDSTVGFAAGTHVVIDRLVAYVGGEEMPDFGAYYSEVEPKYEAWTASDPE
jgi:uncharacterized protein YndB with AHSA1/START domain